jgi:predicted thioesterase
MEDPMKASLAAGASATARIVVDRERTIDFMGENARVYATPMLVRDVEIAARDLIGRHLDLGEDTVGIRIELDHLAATLLGMPVELGVRIAAVEGRVVTVDFEGRDSVDVICRGRHRRFVVDVAATQARLAAKAAKAAQAASPERAA